MGERGNNHRDTVQSVVRALGLLKVLAGGVPRTARELAEAANMDRTVTHRLLKTLEQEGMAIQQGASWKLGHGALMLGMAYLERLPFAAVARPYAIDLQRKVVGDHPWVVSLGTPIGDEVVLVDQFWGPNSPLNSILSIGTRLPLNRTATGYAILSKMSQGEAASLVGPGVLSELSEILEEVRANGGLAMASDNLQSGVGVIAAAVCDRTGSPVGAVNISGIQLHEHLDPRSPVAEHVERTADAISAALR